MTAKIHRIRDVRYTKITITKVGTLIKLMDGRVLEIESPTVLWRAEVLDEVSTGYSGLQKEVKWLFQGYLEEDPKITKKKVLDKKARVLKLRKERNAKQDREAQARRDGRWWRRLWRRLFSRRQLPIAKVNKI